MHIYITMIKLNNKNSNKQNVRLLNYSKIRDLQSIMLKQSPPLFPHHIAVP
jgi:hypothetical protein